jgi:hypothetical protein
MAIYASVKLSIVRNNFLILYRHAKINWAENCFFNCQKVIEVAKKYFPTISCSFESPKVKLHVGDGFQYVKEHAGQFDVIITDSSDPVGGYRY